MRYAIVAVLALLLSLLALPVEAQVHVDIGIHFPAPPPLVVVPSVPQVQYVPEAPANVFFYAGQYYVFQNGGWFVSPRHSGPWVVVAPQYVPRPLLLVPVQYYRVPPGHWKEWKRREPPRWRQEYGNEWGEKRRWKGEDDDGDRGSGRGRGRER